jgi:predicted phosphoribosyltransferase
MLLKNRSEAGYLLALKLKKYANNPQGLVLGLPRGGIPVAYEIAKYLHLPLDLCLVRKLGVPKRPELAMGAIAWGGVKVFNQDIINELKITATAIEKVVEQELAELSRRERIYRGNRPLPTINGKIIILVDDGIATGATLKAAIMTLKKQQPKQIIVAVPIVSLSMIPAIEAEIDSLVCLMKPENLNSISLWYEDFSQTSDEEVTRLLKASS